ncbi:hypothetical protein G8S49_02515 [Clostridium botulinum C]|uniref:Uncharacterized protein n=3 Tax=Clostridium botulinum TaxID=1491 RepID=A0A9Q4TN52_CLOBO|nr:MULTISPECIES: hypothetical protein [Clostridium]EGO87068.2 hypothetical protein CBCST_14264 [Clostridium botulinum C str. Stockholm]AYF54742.1 hypothetical protein DFH04_08495 [Clostridium novyi]MCD3194413.1 hypothetical protein [Clostridium botulinum C]MCD3199567.1 hypothetical protein [Clostridium botulinum C]MCD3205042.1 hypothetical protein [Clostridium botulinum C]
MFMNIYNNQCMNPCLQAPSGFMDVINKGAYVATFAIAYFLNGNHFSFDSPKLLYNQSYRISIPVDATAIIFLARFYLTPTQTRIICRKEYSTSFRKYMELGGTIANPTCTEIGLTKICISYCFFQQ